MRNFYFNMAKRIPFIWWKFIWLRLVQAHLNNEKANAQTLTSLNRPFG